MGMGTMRRLGLAAILSAAAVASAQVITTFAGGGVGDGGPATSAGFDVPRGIALDATGNLFIADQSRVRRVDASTGTISTFAGTGETYYSGDGGAASAARLNGAWALAFDPAGNLIIAEWGNRVIRRVNAATGVITTIAGQNLQYGFFGDGGPAVQAWFMNIRAVGVDPGGNIFIADDGYHRVRRIDAATGIINTVAGGGGQGDGAFADAADVAYPCGLAMAPNGDYYIGQMNAGVVRKVTAATGRISTVAGNSSAVALGDGGAATAARLEAPCGLALDSAGNLFIAEMIGNRVRRVDAATGLITTVAGGGLGGDGPATSAMLNNPLGLAVDSQGRVVIAETTLRRVRRLEAGNVTTIAGGPFFTGDGMQATQARIEYPYGIAFDGAGNAFIADQTMRLVRRVDASTGVITTVAGNGQPGSTGDGGAATSAPLSPSSIAADGAGNVYIADTVALRVRKVAAGSGIVSTVAGNGTTAYGGDGLAATTTGIVPDALVVDSQGNLYIADSLNQRVRKVLAGSGLVSTVAAVSSRALAIDAADNVYVGYQGGVSRIEAGTGLVSTVFATSLSMDALARDSSGNFYFTTRGNNLVRRWFASTGQLSVFAGGAPPFLTPLGDGGPATSASLFYQLDGLAFRAGALYIADTGHLRVRKVTLPPLEAGPGALAFDGRLPQTTSLPRRVVLTNVTGSAITINSINVTGAGFALAANDCGASIASNASCNLDVTFTPASATAYSGSIDIGASTGAQAVPLSGVGEVSLVTHYYESILRRAPDAGGKQFWDNERIRMTNLGANVNETWFAMSSFFLRSPEYVAFNRNATDFTTDLYKTFFNRAPDAGGQQFWIDQMAGGMPREVVVASFQHSPEFATFTQGLFGNTAVRAEMDMVMDFYRGLLARLPDDRGFNSWVQQFRGAQCNANPSTAVAAMAEQMSEAFVTSGEYVGRGRTNAQYVGDLYNAFLRRGGDLTGVNTWINSLDTNTYTRKQVRDAFRASTEFQGRVTNVANQGCLQ